MRRTEATTTTSVRHVAKPMGRNDENGPHLSDRAWFAALLDESRDDIAQACGDPGSFVDRNMDESVSRWSGRAVIAAIKQRAGMSS